MSAERIAAIDRAVTAELKALNLLDTNGVSVLVSTCMDCAKPYAAHLVCFNDGARIAVSHGICEQCNDDRVLADKERLEWGS